MKHDVDTTAKATGVTVGVIYLVCAFSVILFPGLAMSIAQSWFHGLNLSKISGFSVTPGSFVLGFVTSTAGGWLIGYIFAKAYNFLLKK
ncbi:MAG: hypothetical protein US60_C0002G0022 [Microgenomates group bacterium GW2011_GWC1_37_8]|uniref:TVP38/TMEM64 family membrane protein n=1 Tax=Candidatus Woesebacteria bacterium GW2011_GWB1_38_8 TaxID=1618570 RepID=A0A0G0LC54_9BACT|nr:MAG: hypothetical protein US60_C0002G0022 [Microgenomates group bacterium GW2011_GWC1_37_8]KKQ85460.1 MAG: hypothetical protein UT08_C0006G0043 [Candidatus Woesebacteria bacterium GW2011_GWB1_38_8]